MASDEVEPYSLPTSWRWSRLGLIGRVVGGGTPKTGEPDYWADGPERGCTPWLTPADLYGFKAKRVAFGRRFITKRGLEESSARVLPPGAVLFSSRAPIGYVAIAEVELATNQGFKSIVPWIGDMSEYIYLFLQSAARAIDAAASGTTFKEVSGKDVSLVWIPVPPLAEQKRIVAKVDELMRLIDDLEAKQAKKREVQTRFRTSALDALTRAEGAEELGTAWKRVAGNWATVLDDSSAVAAFRSRLLQLLVDGRLHGWAAPASPGRFGDSFTFVNGFAFKSEWFQPNGVRLLRNVNIGHGQLRWNEVACVSEERAEEFERFLMREGDVVVSLDRPIIATGIKIARVCAEDLPCLLLQRVAKIVPRDATSDVEYLFLWLQSPRYTQAIDPGRSNGVPHISTKEIGEIPLALPPLDLQRRIVADARKWMKLCDDLEARLRAKETTAAKLVEAVVRDLSA